MKGVKKIIWGIIIGAGLSYAQVYLYDDFQGNAIDTTKWEILNNGGSYTMSNGILTIYNGSSYNGYFGIKSKVSGSYPAKISFRVRTTLDTSVGRYQPLAGFHQLLYDYSNYIVYPGGSVQIWHYGLVSQWKTDSIVWVSPNVVKFYVENNLVYTYTGSVPEPQKAYFLIRCDQAFGCNIYYLQVDWVEMTGASGIRENVSLLYPEILYIPLTFEDWILVRFSKPINIPLSFSLFDLNGKKIFEKKFSPNAPYILLIDRKIEKLPEGIYFLKIISPNGTKIKECKIMKLK